MRYQVLEAFRVKTSQGERELTPGQVISCGIEKALRLISSGKIAPVERVAYKVFSETLQAFLWVVADERDIKALRASQDVIEAIYTADEIQKLKSMDGEGLKAIHRVREIFENSKVETVNTVN